MILYVFYFKDSVIRLYIMHIEGIATQGIEALQAALAGLWHASGANIEVHIAPLDTLVM